MNMLLICLMSLSLPVLIAVTAAVLPRCPERRRDALKALEILARRKRR